MLNSSQNHEWGDEDASSTFSGTRGGWLLTFVVAFFVLELTADPALTSIIGCGKIGWADMLTAFWLRRRDPQLTRGRASFWLYLALGLWKVFMLSMVVAIGLAWGMRVFGVAAPRRLATILLVEGWIGLTLCALASLTGVAVARRHNLRIWVSDAMHDARRHDVWPPRIDRHEDRGAIVGTLARQRTLFAFGAFVLFICGMIGMVFTILFLFDQVRIPAVAAFALPVAIVFWLFAMMRGITILWRLMEAQVFARRPEECWPEAFDERLANLAMPPNTPN